MSIFVISETLVEAVISTGAAFDNLQGSCSYASDEAKHTDDCLYHHFGDLELEETPERFLDENPFAVILIEYILHAKSKLAARTGKY